MFFSYGGRLVVKSSNPKFLTENAASNMGGQVSFAGILNNFVESIKNQTLK